MTLSKLQPMLLVPLLALWFAVASAEEESEDSLRGTSSSGIVGNISDSIQVGPGIAAAIAIIVGATMNLFGYKLLRPTMFACGFLVGGYLVSAVVEYIVEGQSYHRTAFWISFLIGGVVLGSLVVAIYNFGIFLIGAAAGVFLATIINASFGYRIYPNDPTTGLLIMAIVLGLICGIISYKVERLAIIAATALVGSVVLVNGVGYFIGNFPKLTGIKDYRHEDDYGDYVYDVPQEWWAYLVAMLVIFLAGLTIQIKTTSKMGRWTGRSVVQVLAAPAGFYVLVYEVPALLTNFISFMKVVPNESKKSLMIRVKGSTPPLAVALLQLCVAFVIGNDSENGSTSAMDGSIDDTSNSFEGAAELLSSAKDIRVGAALVAAIAILGGGIICLAGYRLFRPTVFFCAFMVGGFFIAGIIETAFASMTWMPTASWIGFGVGGVIAGVVVLMLYSASIFMAGAVGGIMLAFTINTSVGTRIYPNNPGIIFILLAVLLGILGGLLALKLERPVLIVTTAIVGSTTCIAGLGYFIGDYPNGADLKEFGFKNMKGDWVYDLPDAWWGYLAAMIVLFLVGLTVQLRKTAWGYDHSGNRGSQGLSKGNANV